MTICKYNLRNLETKSERANIRLAACEHLHFIGAQQFFKKDSRGAGC